MMVGREESMYILRSKGKIGFRQRGGGDRSGSCRESTGRYGTEVGMLEMRWTYSVARRSSSHHQHPLPPHRHPPRSLPLPHPPMGRIAIMPDGPGSGPVLDGRGLARTFGGFVPRYGACAGAKSHRRRGCCK